MVNIMQFTPLADYLRRWLSGAPAAGLAIAVTDRQRTLYTAGLGYADADAGRPVLADTTFQIGSIGKSMTALALMQLVESGRLDLNAPLSTHLPWFAIPSRYGPIALRHVMSHTAGLPAGADFAPSARYEGYALRDTAAAWEPGARFHYSNTGYKLLGWLLEDITGRDYGDAIRQRVLEPLGMTATVPVITHQTRHRMATGYVSLHDDRPYRRGDTLIPATWMEYKVGDGSQAATAEDMARYARLWLNGGRSGVRALVSAASYARITTPVIAMSRGDNYEHDYGYGFGIISHQADGHRFIGHGGSTVGFRAIMLTDQTDGLGVTLLCNGSDVDTYAPARYALQAAAAVRRGSAIPEPPPIPDPTRVAGASRYAGDYINPANGVRLSVGAAGDTLRLTGGDSAGVLEQIAGNAFCVPHDAFDPFPLRFRAAGTGNDAAMVEAHHGSDVYVREGSIPPDEAAPYPPEWAALPGHYRSHAPYVSNFYVILRRSRLYLAWPNGGEEALTPERSYHSETDRSATGWFGVGPPGEPTAERLRFDTVVGGRALRARWAGGGDFYRVG